MFTGLSQCRLSVSNKKKHPKGNYYVQVPVLLEPSVNQQHEGTGAAGNQDSVATDTVRTGTVKFK